MIEVKNLNFGYNKFSTVFENLNLRIPEGGVYGLLGPNGAGKSTLLHLMCGLLTPTGGEILFDEINVRKRMPSTLCETFIVPEEFDLPPISMGEYCKINSPFYPNFSIEDLEANLKLFEMDINQNLARLSMGQKKKAYMCFALACNTKLLIMDEPTNGLDITSKVQFRRFISSHMTKDRIIIISTHQVHDVELILDHILILNHNEIVLNSSTREICRRLRFYTSVEGGEANTMVYSVKTFGGNSYVSLRQSEDEETELNLETLFQFCLDCPEMVKDIFKGKWGADASKIDNNDINI